jgi:hypothetical protein
MVGLSLVEAFRRFSEFFLRFHRGAALAVDIEERTLFSRSQALFRASRRLANFLEVPRAPNRKLSDFARD